jgi:uncharacterized protein YndB with AHSA1/START domain
VHLTAELRYDADPAAVFAMLTDPAFQERKLAATGALEHDVTIEARADGGAVVRSRRTMPTDEVPDLVRNLVGQTLTVVQVEDWGPPAADGGRAGTVTVDVSGAPVRLTGTLRLAPAAAGTVESIAGDLKARVPLVGGRIEKAAEPAIRLAIEVEEREGRVWLAA